MFLEDASDRRGVAGIAVASVAPLGEWIPENRLSVSRRHQCTWHGDNMPSSSLAVHDMECESVVLCGTELPESDCIDIRRACQHCWVPLSLQIEMLHRWIRAAPRRHIAVVCGHHSFFGCKRESIREHCARPSDSREA